MISAAQELERAVTKLRLKGAIVNSHTQGEYLDDPKFWDLLAAAEALDVPIAELLVESDQSLSGPILERARMVRLMKTAAAIREFLRERR